jgi:single-strand DNA-binding protein
MRRIELIGNLGKDAELKRSGETDILNFSLAAKGSKKDDESTWFRCAIFGARAVKLAEYLKKGQQVFVRGELKNPTVWEKGVNLDVNCDEVELVGGKREGSSADPAPGGW